MIVNPQHQIRYYILYVYRINNPSRIGKFAHSVRKFVRPLYNAHGNANYYQLEFNSLVLNQLKQRNLMFNNVFRIQRWKSTAFNDTNPCYILKKKDKSY